MSWLHFRRLLQSIWLLRVQPQLLWQRLQSIIRQMFCFGAIFNLVCASKGYSSLHSFCSISFAFFSYVNVEQRSVRQSLQCFTEGHDL
ncbi:hypothetical protein SNOG_14430 [Parastagonospora nodorum SN15]|uniref:Uncharacterized protein n=1 Tax=Phaeosphaeria nodorum (strain SN15 / ATCC MYA-4574 / FGSC 10173) TaxID=321614 RepID=Q0U1Q0_PHANO|nr:hypothetical protein SNOG_14430 [Parastagonospora nodorum SN15]EAT78301.1 hypothetical protein SNOG_14430 [Parastagonospora nodorum SN15]